MIDKPFYRYHDLQAGQVVEVRIKDHHLSKDPVTSPPFKTLRLIYKSLRGYLTLQISPIVFLPCVSPSKGTVSVLLTHGMMVHLSDHIKGMVPRTHLSDIILKNPEKKYVEGMKIKCRVSVVFFLSH